MLVASDLKDAMLASTEQKTDAISANLALGNSISTYLITNTVINFSFSGVNPVPSTITVPATGKITLMPIVLVPSIGAIPAMNIAIGLGIMAGIYIPDAPFVCSPGSMLGFPPTTIVVSGSSRDDAYQMMADAIVKDMTSFVPTVPCAGNYGAYVGACTPTGIE